jgi:hypothetical protein
LAKRLNSGVEFEVGYGEVVVEEVGRPADCVNFRVGLKIPATNV